MARKLAAFFYALQAVAVICKELGVQIHLLIHGLGLAVAKRFDADAVGDISNSQMTGTAWVACKRLAVGIELYKTQLSNRIELLDDAQY